MCESTHTLAQRKLWQRGPAAVLVLLAFAFACIQLHGQATQGSVIGTVKDPNGAVVAGALVTLTNTGEGTQRTARTTSVGDYAFLDVKAGKYQLNIEATGFQKWQATDVTLTVRQELRLDAKLGMAVFQSEDAKEGPRAFAEKRKPNFRGV